MIPLVTASEVGEAQAKITVNQVLEGENPVRCVSLPLKHQFVESSCLGLQLEVGGKHHQRLNSVKRPIANKYREGKMKRTLKKDAEAEWYCRTCVLYSCEGFKLYDRLSTTHTKSTSSSRLETRTKESIMDASTLVSNQSA
ncbi:hypothetical protein BLSTO_03513 [Blastocystis sp. subtype 1]